MTLRRLQDHVLLFAGLLPFATAPLLRPSHSSEHPQGACKQHATGASAAGL
jgi:hypothetical protein